MIIPLMDGREIPAAQITLDRGNQRFYMNSTGEDLTRLIRHADKRTFAGFDATLYNELLYRENHPDAPEVGSTSVTGNFIRQIVTDPLAAPAEQAAKLTESVNKAFSSPLTWIGVAAVVGIGLYFFLPRR